MKKIVKIVAFQGNSGNSGGDGGGDGVLNSNHRGTAWGKMAGDLGERVPQVSRGIPIVDQASDVPSIIFFRLFIDLGHSKLFTFIFVFFRKNKQIENIKYFSKEFCKKL